MDGCVCVCVCARTRVHVHVDVYVSATQNDRTLKEQSIEHCDRLGWADHGLFCSVHAHARQTLACGRG